MPQLPAGLCLLPARRPCLHACTHPCSYVPCGGLLCTCRPIPVVTQATELTMDLIDAMGSARSQVGFVESAAAPCGHASEMSCPWQTAAARSLLRASSSSFPPPSSSPSFPPFLPPSLARKPTPIAVAVNCRSLPVAETTACQRARTSPQASSSPARCVRPCELDQLPACLCLGCRTALALPPALAGLVCRPPGLISRGKAQCVRAFLPAQTSPPAAFRPAAVGGGRGW